MKTIFSTLKFSILAFALMFVAAAPVYAQVSTPAFYPQKAWSVSESQSRGQAGQCVLSTVFNNGFIVQMTQGQSESNPSVFSIDFRQDVFEAGQGYDLNLSLPGANSYGLKAQALSAQILVASITQAQGLITDFGKANAFDLALDDNQFRFLTNGLADGIKRFQECITGGSSEAQAKPQPILNPEPVVAPEPIAAVPVLEKPAEPIDLLGHSEPVPIQEIIPAQPDIKGYEFSQDKDLEALASVSENRPEMTPEKKNYLEKIQSGFEENGDQNAVSVPTNPAPVSEPVVEKIASTEIKTTTSKTKVEVDLTETFKEDEQPSTIEEPFARKGVLMKTNKRQDRAPDVVRSDLPSLDIKPVAPVVAVPAGQSPGVKSATPYIDVHGAPKSVVSERQDGGKTRALQKRIKMLEQQNLILDTELKQALKSSEQERITVASENWNLESATLRYNEAERQIKKLGREVQMQRASCLTEKQELEAMLFDPKIAGESQLADLQRLRNENEALKARINVLESR
jgi:hypothetical protein